MRMCDSGLACMTYLRQKIFLSRRNEVFSISVRDATKLPHLLSAIRAGAWLTVPPGGGLGIATCEHRCTGASEHGHGCTGAGESSKPERGGRLAPHERTCALRAEDRRHRRGLCRLCRAVARRAMG